MKKYIVFLIVLGIFVFGASRAQAEDILVAPCAQNTPRSVTVLSPDGGETYLLGQKIEVTWRSCNVPMAKNIHVSMKNQSTGSTYYLVAYGPDGSGTSNDGVEVVTIPKTIPLGKYKVRVSSFEPGNFYVEDWSNDSFTVNSLSTTIGPVISGVAGPQSLDLGQRGTWKVSAYDKNGGNLSYLVDWGDNNSGCATVPGVDCFTMDRLPPQQSATFTHSYSKEGEYKINFTVISDYGNDDLKNKTATASLTVRVIGIGSSSSITILSPNGGETLKRGEKVSIKWKDSILDTSIGSKYYNISLVPNTSFCNGDICYEQTYSALFSIANKVKGYSFDWKIGDNNSKSLDSNNLKIPDGIYNIKICRTDTDVCDLSDSYFKIVSDDLTDDQPNGCLEDQKYNPKTGEMCKSESDPIVCCESYGYGSLMIKTQSTYQMVPKSQCTVGEGFVGGGKNIVANSFCGEGVYNNPIQIKRTLKVGTKGEDVKTIQSFLNLPVDGSFGPKTMNAVKMFQQKNNLVPDGVVGPKTMLLFK